MTLEQTSKTPPNPRAYARMAPFFPDLEPLNDLLRTPPRTTEDRLLHIEALGRRIESYVRFIGAIPDMVGSSGEAKELGIEAFHACLAALEPPLGRISMNFQRRSPR